MLSDYTLTKESEVEEALNGYPTLEWLAKSSDYAKYKDEYVRCWHYENFREVIGSTLNICYVLTPPALN